MADTGDHDTRNIGHKTFVGSLWMIAARFAVAMMGFIAMVVYARLLTRDDIGIVAMGMLVVMLLEILTTLGVDMQLIRKLDADDDDFNTAWTLRLIQYSTVAVAMWVLAPFAADYFNEARVTMVTRVLSLSMIFMGLENIGIVRFRKDLQFSRVFVFGALRRLTGMTVGVSCAFLLHSYWAMVAGVVTSSLSGAVLSYIMHAYRPKFSLRNLRELWSFSQWLLVLNFAAYINRKADVLVIGRLLGTGSVGLYSIASDASDVPGAAVALPVSQALFPGYSKIANNPARLSAAYLKVTGVLALVMLPAGAGLGAVAENLIPVVFGAKWIDAVPLLQILAVLAVLQVLIGSARNILTVLGRMWQLAVLHWVVALTLVPLLFYAGSTGSLETVAAWRIAVVGVFLPVIFYYAAQVVNVSLLQHVDVLWRPVLAVVVMTAVITRLPSGWAAQAIELTVQIVTGAVVYSLLIAGFWIAAGRPAGAEQTMLEKVFGLKAG